MRSGEAGAAHERSGGDGWPAWGIAPGRRAFLRSVLAWAGAALGPAALGSLAGCGGTPAPAPMPPGPFETRVAALTDLLPAAGLRWVVLAEPRTIAAVPWLIPPIGRVVSEASFTRFAAASGIDLRQAPEAAIASYAGEGALDVNAYAVRHAGDSAVLERLFRARLTGDERRSIDAPDVVRISGTIGRTPRALALIGRDVAVFQEGGSVSRGPARIAALYALGRLRRSPVVGGEEPLKGLLSRFGAAPARAFAVGPFEGELARGARGLLAGATAIGAAARPSVREGVLLTIAVAGDFTTSGEAAAGALRAAWLDLAETSFGRILGLDRPVEPPLATHAPDAVAMAVELDPNKLADGLARLTSDRLDAIMR